ncbi:MAG: ABC transporter permease [Bacilli bacterium]|jgi:simple sugar transport system permease protein
MTKARTILAKPSFFEKVFGFRGVRSVASGLICILIGILIGFLLMLALDSSNALKGLTTLFTYGASSSTTFGRVLYLATPMMLSGLSIAFAFKLGLFNIGITGQFTIGAFVGIITGIAGLPWYVCLIVGSLAGAVLGFVPGILKAKFNVNEVLSGIMLNWIVYYFIAILGKLVIPSSYKDPLTSTYLKTMPSNGLMPALGTDGASWGIIIAIVIIIVFQIILNHTTFGFELRLTGSNKYAAQYSGMNQSKNIILALTLSGAVAGLAGIMFYSQSGNPTRFLWDSSTNTLLGDGFSGISVALIAQCSPIGCILSSILLTYIQSCQTALKGVSNSYNIHYTELIVSIIIYVASFSSFFNYLFVNSNNRKQILREQQMLSAGTVESGKQTPLYLSPSSSQQQQLVMTERYKLLTKGLLRRGK